MRQWTDSYTAASGLRGLYNLRDTLHEEFGKHLKRLKGKRL